LLRIALDGPLGPRTALDLDSHERSELALDGPVVPERNAQTVIGHDPFGAGVGVDLLPPVDLCSELGWPERASDRRWLRQPVGETAHERPPSGWCRRAPLSCSFKST